MQMEPTGAPVPTQSGLQITTPPTSKSPTDQQHHCLHLHHNLASQVNDSISETATEQVVESSAFSPTSPIPGSPEFVHSRRDKTTSILGRLKSYTQQHLQHRQGTSLSAPSGVCDSLPSKGGLLERSVSHSNIASFSSLFQHQRAGPSRVSRCATLTSPTVATVPAASIPPLSHPETLSVSLPLPHSTQVQPSAESVAAAEEPLPVGLIDTGTESDSATSQTPNTTPSLDTPVTVPSTNPNPSALGPSESRMTRTRSATEASLGQSNGSNSPDVQPSIRFSTFYDPRATRPSLTFTPIARTLPTGSEIIRVGRYSERDNQPGNVPNNSPSAAPVGFKSKVVSRRHCEFWYESGKWYIKDVKSSSGTFLNHIRLSPPGTESRPYAINDGDIIQLGIDFKGGEDMIFRCVKMRLELNRGWQNKLNTFNMSTHKRLRNMTKSSDTANSTQSSQDCSICLNVIAPCQCLFVAPCSHTWHFKCVRSLLNSPSYPIFICPNCRAAADLEAEVEEMEEWEKMDSEEGVPDDEDDSHLPTDAESSIIAEPPAPAPREEPTVIMPPRPTSSTMEIDYHLPPAIPIPPPVSATANSSGTLAAQARTPPAPGAMAAPPRQGQAGGVPNPNHEGPITPRNDAGPWVFDGSGVRTRGSLGGRTSGESGRMRSLDRAAADLAQVTSG